MSLALSWLRARFILSDIVRRALILALVSLAIFIGVASETVLPRFTAASSYSEASSFKESALVTLANVPVERAGLISVSF